LDSKGIHLDESGCLARCRKSNVGVKKRGFDDLSKEAVSAQSIKHEVVREALKKSEKRRPLINRPRSTLPVRGNGRLQT